MEAKKLKPLDMNKILSKKPVKTISTQESLKDVTPVSWDESVRRGERKITISFNK